MCAGKIVIFIKVGLFLMTALTSFDGLNRWVSNVFFVNKSNLFYKNNSKYTSATTKRFSNYYHHYSQTLLNSVIIMN